MSSGLDSIGSVTGLFVRLGCANYFILVFVEDSGSKRGLASVCADYINNEKLHLER